jgi:hypothetical protein
MKSLTIEFHETDESLLMAFFRKLKIKWQSPAELDPDFFIQEQPKKKRRVAGFSKARFAMSDDFNATLDDFKEYM